MAARWSGGGARSGRSTRVVGLAVWLAVAMGAEVVAEPPLVPLESFFVEPRIVQVTLSPAGDAIAYVLRESHGVSLWLAETDGTRPRRRLDTRDVRRLAWSANGSGLFFVTDSHVAYLPAASGRARLLVARPPTPTWRYRGVDPRVPDHVLVTDQADDGRHRLVRHGLDGSTAVLWQDEAPIRRFALDARGDLLYLQGTDGDDIVIDRMVDGERTTVLRCGFRDACRLLAVANDGRLWLERRLDGGRWSLVAFDAEAGTTEVVHRDPAARDDLDEVVFDPISHRPLLAVHHTSRRRNHGLRPEVARHLARIEGARPRDDLYLAPRESGAWLVVERSARTHHPTYHAYDPSTGTLTPLLSEARASRPGVPSRRLADRQPIVFQASDGMRLGGFLSVPAARTLATVPLVVKVHGGPWDHDRSGFDAFTQFLVSRGYAVFEPNFRGSTGTGLDTMLAARGGFGDGRVHRDIVDGTDHVLAMGIGDPERVAMVGHSFGGFSALGAVAFSPERYRAAMATAPAIDLVRALRDIEGQEGFLFELEVDRALRLLLAEPDDPDGERRLRRQSPEARLGDTARPVLIIAGGRDAKVDIVDVRHYAAALDGLGKDVSLLVDDEAGHALRGHWLARAYFVLAERFLARHLGGAVSPLGDDELRRYLDSRLSLRSASLDEALLAKGR